MGAAYSELVSLETVELLIDKGANARVKTEGGITALSLARKRGRTKVVELLEKVGATE